MIIARSIELQLEALLFREGIVFIGFLRLL